MNPEQAWAVLRGRQEPSVVWVRPVSGPVVAVLLGAFDPPTRAHLAIARGVARLRGVPAALCLTSVLLDRPADRLLDDATKLSLLAEVADSEGLGFAISNRGTYLEVAQAVRADGIEPIFVIGSDKLDQLADPSFYPDGAAGVATTFDEVVFVVVPRAGAAVDVAADVIEASDVFSDPEHTAISGTEVRRRVRAGLPLDDLVPAAVARALEGYTDAEPT